MFPTHIMTESRKLVMREGDAPPREWRVVEVNGTEGLTLNMSSCVRHVNTITRAFRLADPRQNARVFHWDGDSADDPDRPGNIIHARVRPAVQGDLRTLVHDLRKSRDLRLLEPLELEVLLGNPEVVEDTLCLAGLLAEMHYRLRTGAGSWKAL